MAVVRLKVEREAYAIPRSELGPGHVGLKRLQRVVIEDDPHSLELKQHGPN